MTPASASNNQAVPWIERFKQGDGAALARVISLLENRDPLGQEIYSRVYGLKGPAWRIGITGATGVGKSTLIARLAREFRSLGHSIGIVAIDPSSPFSNGALLGDRLRMNDLIMDDDVFIRSMATRGIVGGLARATRMATDMLEAFGKDIVFIETVGVGQSEKDILNAADTAAVVLMPHSGDFVQIMKAGIMEIANVFVLNKSDQPGASDLSRDLNAYLEMHHAASAEKWRPPVVATQADRCLGIDELRLALRRHHGYIEQDDTQNAKRQRIRTQIMDLYWEDLQVRLRATLNLDTRVEASTQAVLKGQSNPVCETTRLLQQTHLPMRDYELTNAKRADIETPPYEH